MKRNVWGLFIVGLFLVLTGCGDDDSVEVEDDTDITIDPVEISSCSSTSGIEKLVCIAEAFKSQLSSSQLSSLQLTYSTSSAQKWSNFPEEIYGQRPGLSFGEMTDTQISYAKTLLKTAAGTVENEGYDELEQMLNADDYLNADGAGDGYGSDNYYLAILGDPSATGLWEIMFGGHHFAFANTYENGVLTGGTPSFRGVEPFGTFTYDGESNQPLNQEQEALSTMLTALSSDELAAAELSGTYGDMVAGPQNDDNFPSSSSGLKVSELSSDKQALVLAAIETYVADLSDSEAAAFMSLYESELSDTYIGYSGSTGVITRNDYVRIDGPSVWIEYSVQGGIIYKDETHPHSVWRDKSTDYGGN